MRRLRKQGWAGWMCLLLLAAAPAAMAFSDADAVRVIGFSRFQLADSVAELPGSTRSPKASLSNGTWTTVANTDKVAWTQGFFPGQLWFMYQVGGEPIWRERADRWTRPLEVQKTNTETHDLGFKMLLPFGNAYKLTGDTYYRDVLLTSAASLATRYNSRIGAIDCCDWNPDWDLPVVADTMVDIELLLWGAANGGRPEWRTMAINHALRTLSDIVRPDGSSYHVVNYNSSTGAIRSRGTFQGYSDSSTWSRGQAWLIYGFTVVYRYTGDTRFLTAARRVTDYYLSRLPADMVPNWDFDAPSQFKDSSAAAAVASALLELSSLETDATRRTNYRAAALRMLDSLAGPAYFAEDSGSNTPGLLRHAVGNYPAGQEIDVSLIYGDYYFLEAVLRFNPTPPYPWYSKVSYSRSQHILGGGNTGVRGIEFDLTPLRDVVDGGVVGWTDSSTEVTGVTSLSMLLRLNADGTFEVRNGGGYAAVTRVPYVRSRTYHVRVRAELGARRYSVWIRPPGGSEILIADRYAFRSDAPAMDDIGRASVKSYTEDSEFKVVGHRVYATTVAATASASALTEAPRQPLEDVTSPDVRLVALEEGDSGPAVLAAAVDPEDLGAMGCTSAAAAPVPLAVLGVLAWMARRKRSRADTGS